MLENIKSGDVVIVKSVTRLTSMKYDVPIFIVYTKKARIYKDVYHVSYMFETQILESLLDGALDEIEIISMIENAI